MNNIDQQGIGMTSMRTRERLIGKLRDEGVENLRVLDAMRQVPRHLFLDEAFAHRAYENTALPIGHGQTLSQPYIVARMTEIVLAKGIPDRILEIGTGSGYQAAVLAQLCPKVYTVERIEDLLKKARQRFAMLGYRNLFTKYADGHYGWKERGPYNAILSAAAPSEIPQELIDQLAPDGILVSPVSQGDVQFLHVMIRKGSSQEFEKYQVEPVKFVPFVAGTR